MPSYNVSFNAFTSHIQGNLDNYSLFFITLEAF